MSHYWLLALVFLLCVGTGTSEVTIKTLFTLLTGNGECSDDYVNLMDDYLTDVSSLASAFDAAIEDATDNPEQQDGWVARALFKSWFGIVLDENGEATSETEAQWQTVKDINTKLKSFMAGSGVAAPQTPPELLCDGSGFARYAWDASVEKWDAETKEYYIYTIDDEEPELSDIYGYDADLVPYLLENNHNYYAVKAGASDNNICVAQTGAATLYGQAFSGQAETIKTYLANPVHMPAISPLILMCPATLAQTSLDNIIEQSVDFDVGVTQISALTIRARGPTTLFHEFIHLISFWTEGDGGSFTFNEDTYVTDYSYDVDQCLWMAFSEVTVDVPQEDGTTKAKTFYPKDTVRNAESYTFFALAYWYYIETGQTFYSGFLSDWDPNAGAEAETGSTKRSTRFTAHRYGHWLGRTHRRVR
ncbi:hypothetical protein N7493_006407 [Penicillium malachiteum]|uniref:Lysine-specific metallo-endopeptidase domain-containing protein n=1 Tax=Penicillium malachiteum TaxID=1324776 RepID=A0AAD6HKI8_9EURO|nr:hypothetical protein N7493_006407 [Penicillium malachiteum]